MMTRIEITQMREFGRYDGLIIGAIWAVCFILQMTGLRTQNGLLLMLGDILIVASPFFIWRRCIQFRDDIMEGSMSFGRSYAYSFIIIWHAALIIAATLFVYFAFLDNGGFILSLSKLQSDQDAQESFKLVGLSLNQFIDIYSQLTPVQHAYLAWMNIVLISLPLSLPIAFFTKSLKSSNSQTDTPEK